MEAKQNENASFDIRQRYDLISLFADRKCAESNARDTAGTACDANRGAQSLAVERLAML